MSAWYLFSALGLFPAAGSNVYFVTAPLFDDVEIDLPTARRSAVTDKSADLGCLASGARRRGTRRPAQSGPLRHADLLSGVELDFTVVE
ncbi:MAG: glycoside hydrolase family 92 protein [Myxococcales bacterium]|nr:glycoside hydrolase family 92 protein [Myxococcales bacterium]